MLHLRRKYQSLKIFGDIVFQKGQTHFAGFALFVWMIYRINEDYFQLVHTAKYQQDINRMILFVYRQCCGLVPGTNSPFPGEHQTISGGLT